MAGAADAIVADEANAAADAAAIDVEAEVAYAMATRRIEEWIDNNDDSVELDLSEINLAELPNLPSKLQKLNCSDNQLT